MPVFILLFTAVYVLLYVSTNLRILFTECNTISSMTMLNNFKKKLVFVLIFAC